MLNAFILRREMFKLNLILYLLAFLVHILRCMKGMTEVTLMKVIKYLLYSFGCEDRWEREREQQIASTKCVVVKLVRVDRRRPNIHSTLKYASNSNHCVAKNSRIYRKRNLDSPTFPFTFHICRFHCMYRNVNPINCIANPSHAYGLLSGSGTWYRRDAATRARALYSDIWRFENSRCRRHTRGFFKVLLWQTRTRVHKTHRLAFKTIRDSAIQHFRTMRWMQTQRLQCKGFIVPIFDRRVCIQVPFPMFIVVFSEYILGRCKGTNCANRYQIHTSLYQFWQTNTHRVLFTQCVYVYCIYYQMRVFQVICERATERFCHPKIRTNKIIRIHFRKSIVFSRQFCAPRTNIIMSHGHEPSDANTLFHSGNYVHRGMHSTEWATSRAFASPEPHNK